jgi:hypothetical protein
VAKTLGPRSPPRLLREETGLHRLDEDLVRVVSETLQLDAARAHYGLTVGFIAELFPPQPRPWERRKDLCTQLR